MNATGGFSRRSLIITGGLAVLIGIVLYAAVMVEELGHKEAWAVLQAAELQHRRDATANTLVVENARGTQYTLLGIPTGDSRAPRVWLILNDDSNDAVKILPRTMSFHLPCDYVSDLQRKVRIEAAVRSFLEQRCENSTND